MLEGKPHFIEHEPFARRRAYYKWVKLNLITLILLGTILGCTSCFFYQKSKALLLECANLEASLVRFDDVRRTIEQLQEVEQDDFSDQDGIHKQILDFLAEIERTLTGSVHLNSIEFSARQIDLSGYSQNMNCLIRFIENLKHLPLGQERVLEQITQTKKLNNAQLGFTVSLKLSK